MDHDPETNTLYVHGITGRRRDRTVEPIRRWEDLLLVVFQEGADPGDEPPPRPSERAPDPARERDEARERSEARDCGREDESVGRAGGEDGGG